eukprot:gene7321-11640_t
MNQELSLLDLSPEVIQEIFYFLEPKYSFRCISVNKDLNNILLSKEHLESMKNNFESTKRLKPSMLSQLFSTLEVISICSMAQSKKCISCLKTDYRQQYDSFMTSFCDRCAFEDFISQSSLEKCDYFIRTKDLSKINNINGIFWKVELDLLPNREEIRNKKLEKIKKKLNQMDFKLKEEDKIEDNIEEKLKENDGFVLERFTKSQHPDVSNIESEIDTNILEMNKRELKLKFLFMK